MNLLLLIGHCQIGNLTYSWLLNQKKHEHVPLGEEVGMVVAVEHARLLAEMFPSHTCLSSSFYICIVCGLG